MVDGEKNTKGEVVGDCARDDKDGDGKGDGLTEMYVK